MGLEPSEHPAPGALVGPLFVSALRRQFERLRGADRFWYARDLPRPLVLAVEQMTLARIIRANTSIVSIQADVVHVPGSWRRAPL